MVSLIEKGKWLGQYNVLYIIQNSEFGGGERGFSQLFRGLNKNFRIFVVTTPKGRFYREIRAAGATVIEAQFARRDLAQTTVLLKRAIKKEKIHIVHSQGARADFFARLAGCWSRTTVTICTLQMPVEGFNVSRYKKFIYIILDRVSERFVDRFIVPSRSLKKHLIGKRGISENNIALIYNGIELQHYRPDAADNRIREKLKILRDVPLIGAIGRMVWQKGFEFLIKAIPEIVRVIPEAKFVFVGEGPLRGKLGALSEELRVRDKIIFTGFRDDIKEILSTIDILVVPSLLEGFPMVTLEAMAMAKPIIATKIDGIAEQITDGENGILVPPKDHLALAGAILRLLQDRDFSKKIGIAAREKVEKEFSVEKMVIETERVYLSLLGTKLK